MMQTAPRVDGWGGTVSSSYRMGTKIVLVVRIGRFVALRTSYIDEDGGSLIERSSPAFARAAELNAGDAVIVSGSFMSRPEGCIFGSGEDDGSQVQMLFRFTEVQKS